MRRTYGRLSLNRQAALLYMSNQMDENEADLINIGYGLKLAVSLAVMYAGRDGMRWKYE